MWVGTLFWAAGSEKIFIAPFPNPNTRFTTEPPEAEIFLESGVGALFWDPPPPGGVWVGALLDPYTDHWVEGTFFPGALFLGECAFPLGAFFFWCRALF